MFLYISWPFHREHTVSKGACSLQKITLLGWFQEETEPYDDSYEKQQEEKWKNLRKKAEKMYRKDWENSAKKVKKYGGKGIGAS